MKQQYINFYLSSGVNKFMRPNLVAVPGGAVWSLLLLFAISALPSLAASESEVPQAVRDLLPASLQLKTQSWSIIKTEFGTVISGDMHALFPGSVSCDFTIGPEFHLELKGDSAWEGSQEQLDMWVQMNQPNFQRVGEGMASSTSNMLRGLGDELSVGVPQQEQLPKGHVTYVEFTWTCAKNPGGRNVKLQGHARKGATVLEFGFWANGGSEEAIALAQGIFAKFEKLDIDALRQ